MHLKGQNKGQTRNKTEITKKVQKISWLFERINQTDKPINRLSKKVKTQVKPKRSDNYKEIMNCSLNTEKLYKTWVISWTYTMYQKFNQETKCKVVSNGFETVIEGSHLPSLNISLNTHWPGRSYRLQGNRWNQRMSCWVNKLDTNIWITGFYSHLRTHTPTIWKQKR